MSQDCRLQHIHVLYRTARQDSSASMITANSMKKDTCNLSIALCRSEVPTSIKTPNFAVECV